MADGQAREPVYRHLWAGGALQERTSAARARLSACDLCARYCLVDRTHGISVAACRTGVKARVASFGPHFGEEAPLSGWAGSGTIFFAHCNMRCVYCQNDALSWQGEGNEVTAAELAAIMISLQDNGCHNINLVSPSHVVAQILDALVIAAGEGLRLPLVYNTGGYDSPEALALLDGVVDIYMPDIKYADDDRARRYSKVRDYGRISRAAVREMHRQVGNLVVDGAGLAVRGLLVRHLVLPNDLGDTETVLRFVAEDISPETYVNIMGQYRPCFRAHEIAELARRPTAEELDRAWSAAERLGLRRRDTRPRRSRGWPF